MRVMLDKFTLMGRLNGINFQAEYKVECDDGESVNSLELLNNITEKARLFGVEPPVPARNEVRKVDRVATGATGVHPDDKVFYLDGNGNQVKCPDCKQVLFMRSGISKKNNRAWAKWYCTSCLKEDWIKTH